MNEQFLKLITALAAPSPYEDGDPYVSSPSTKQIC
jgi:hypothetical protein